MQDWSHTGWSLDFRRCVKWLYRLATGETDRLATGETERFAGDAGRWAGDTERLSGDALPAGETALAGDTDRRGLFVADIGEKSVALNSDTHLLVILICMLHCFES